MSAMVHPLMFDPGDPLLQRLRAVCLTFPEAQERVSHGRPNFHTVRTFCYFGGSVRRGAGDWVAHDAAILVRPDPDDEPALRQDARFFVPAYLGASGWLGIDLADVGWIEIAELVDASYRVTAPARLVRQLG